MSTFPRINQISELQDFVGIIKAKRTLLKCPIERDLQIYNHLVALNAILMQMCPPLFLFLFLQVHKIRNRPFLLGGCLESLRGGFLSYITLFAREHVSGLCQIV